MHIVTFSLSVVYVVSVDTVEPRPAHEHEVCEKVECSLRNSLTSPFVWTMRGRNKVAAMETLLSEHMSAVSVT